MGTGLLSPAPRHCNKKTSSASIGRARSFADLPAKVNKLTFSSAVFHRIYRVTVNNGSLDLPPAFQDKVQLCSAPPVGDLLVSKQDFAPVVSGALGTGHTSFLRTLF